MQETEQTNDKAPEQPPAIQQIEQASARSFNDAYEQADSTRSASI